METWQFIVMIIGFVVILAKLEALGKDKADLAEFISRSTGHSSSDKDINSK